MSQLFDILIFRSCGASGMFDVYSRSLELFQSSSKYFPHSSNSSLFTGGSTFHLLTFVTRFVIDFPVMSLMMENPFYVWFRVAASLASTDFCCR